MNEKEKGLFMLAKQWDEMHPRIEVALNKVNDMHVLVPEIHSHTRDLSNLSALPNIAAHLKILSEHLVTSATGRDCISTKTATLIFKILGVVIIALLLMIIFLLTGDHFSLLPHLKGLR
ncbi:hypothetical protein EKK58_11995 [Candidatus Dependentiae bacterium]|nr:MAG: hypothetical protein EKK58_11995 [Candidatus Dependentiae bacterium]